LIWQSISYQKGQYVSLASHHHSRNGHSDDRVVDTISRGGNAVPQSVRAAEPVRRIDSEYCKQEGGIFEMKRPIAKKTKKPRPWTKEDVRMLKTMLREKTKTSVIAPST